MSLLKERFMVSWIDVNGVAWEIPPVDSREAADAIANAVGDKVIVTISIVTPVERRYPARPVRPEMVH